MGNTGAEIAQARLPELFEPFRRLHGEERGRGAGLGPSIVRAVVESHRGDLKAKPRAGGGLDVEVLLAAERPDGASGEMRP